MKIAIIRAILFCSLFTSIQSWGQTVIISDIDDTIKVSNILDTFESIENALKVESFWQMTELYQALADRGAEIFYVSNAPLEVMELPHANFLDVNAYPEGPLLLPAFDERTDHKIRWIKKIIDEKKPELVVLLGDNGEKDIHIYNEAVNSYSDSGIKFLTFIRINYFPSSSGASSPLAGQKSFVSAGEIALPLYDHNLISSQDTEELLKSSVSVSGLSEWWKEVRKPGASLKLPEWVNCRSHKADLSSYYDFSPSVKTLEEKISKRCSKSKW